MIFPQANGQHWKRRMGYRVLGVGMLAFAAWFVSHLVDTARIMTCTHIGRLG